MSIVIIKGPEGSGKTTIANALRNSSITGGALLIDEDQHGEVKPLVEKILKAIQLPIPNPGEHIDAFRARVRADIGVELPPATGSDEKREDYYARVDPWQHIDFSKLPWKDNPSVIIVGEHGQKRLAEIEDAVPGFTEHFGPVYNVTTALG